MRLDTSPDIFAKKFEAPPPPTEVVNHKVYRRSVRETLSSILPQPSPEVPVQPQDTLDDNPKDAEIEYKEGLEPKKY